MPEIEKGDIYEIQPALLIFHFDTFGPAGAGLFFASNIFPLEPPDTSSPRATFSSFIHYTDELYAAATAAEEDLYLAREFMERAERCFDFSQVPPTLLKDVSIESVLRLREIMDRIELPELTDIPDKHEAKANNILLWRIPHTEITIGRCPDGPRMGSYLFTPETVRRLAEYYDEVNHLPYRSDKGPDYTGFYEQYIYSSGWMIPDGFLKKTSRLDEARLHGTSCMAMDGSGFIFSIGKL